MDLQALVAALGEKIGLGTWRLDDGGSLALRFADAHDVFLAEDPANGQVLLYATVLPGSVLNDPGVCRRLLAIPLLGVNTGGGTFSLHEEADAVVFWKRHDEFPDLVGLERAMEDFLAALVFWKEHLREELRMPEEKTASPHSLPQAEEKNYDFSGDGLLRV